MKQKPKLYYVLIIFLTAMLIISGIQVGRYAADALRQKNTYDDLTLLMEQARTMTTPPTAPTSAPESPTGIPESTPTEPLATETTEPTEPVMLPEYAALYEKNPDTVGWLKIEGTVINYPVMQTPDRVDYYLKRDFNGNHSEYGCLYVRETCDVFAPSDNVTIYGHHMKNGSMFGSLKKYRSQSFWEKHPVIQFDTLYEEHTYTIFAVFTTTASVGQGFPYHTFDDAADEADFDEFVVNCKALSLYDTGITPQYGDKLICLSTCEYSQVNGRLVVVAVRDTQNDGVA